jgi:nucleotide-binding universal stress UspA family protein
VVSEILAVAEEIQAGLIVLGVHAPAHSWLPGTEPAAYKILVSAPCPVLSLRVNAPVGERAEHREEEAPAIFG